MKTVPPAIRAAFLTALGPLSRNAAALPDPLPLDRVLFLVDRGKGDGEAIRVLASHDDDGYRLDYFRVIDSVSRHGRIHQDGRIEKLENYEAQFGVTEQADPAATARERERVGEHNRRVTELLRSKGFED